MIAKRRALGRGIGALIPNAVPADEARATTVVPLVAIRPNPHQPRRNFPQAAIDELADSIRQKGILQPLLVRQDDTGYELIAGERRYRAACQLGLADVPVIVREATEGEMLEISVIENIQREDLNPLEEARAYRRLIAEFDLTQDEIAARVGKKRSTVANTIRLLQLPEAIQEQIECGALSAGHARAIASLNEEKAKLDLAQNVLAHRLSVRQTENLAKRQTRSVVADHEQRAVEERLTETLGTRVRLVSRRDGRGRIEIEYYSLDELNGLVDRLSASSALVGRGVF